MNRRNFIKASGISGGGLLLTTFPLLAKKTVDAWEPDFFLKILKDNTILFQCSQAEIGQGTPTGLSMILADELGAKWEDIQIKFADGNHQKYPEQQYTGGSNGIRLLWKPIRESAATARTMLIEAAAQKWKTSTDGLVCQDSFVVNTSTNKKFSFGDLVDVAAKLDAPKEIKLKDKSEFQYIGKSLSGSKNRDIALGKTRYSSNIQLDEMLYAVIARSPVWRGKVKSFQAEKAKSMPGVIDIFEMEEIPLKKDDYLGGVRSGVVVVAKTTWQAIQARKALQIEWDMGVNSTKNEKDILEKINKSQVENNEILFDFLEASTLFDQGEEFLKSNYECPYQTNACMETLNAVAHHRGNNIEVWVGTQCAGKVKDRIAELTKIPPAAVHIHAQPAGGGFGRRFFIDYVEEAVVISEKIRKPVQVLWTREDDITVNKYHPFRVEFWEAALNTNQEPIALKYRGVVSKPMDYRPFPYGLPTVFHAYRGNPAAELLPRASWRSVAAHPWGLGLECFIDELAHKAGKDPLDFRLSLLKKSKTQFKVQMSELYHVNYASKLAQTLELAAKKSGWYKTQKPGHSLGVSAICYNQSACTQIAEVSIENQQLRVHKITAVIHCGMAINPSQVKAQVEGSIVWGLGATLHDPIKINKGTVVQQNFDTYQILRMQECPEIEVHIIESDEAPTGTGEPAVPGVAPAILNAFFALTGRRIDKLPLQQMDLVGEGSK